MGGFHHDPTPRVLAPGQMNTLITSSSEMQFTPLKMDHARLTQSYGLTDIYSVSGAIEGGFLQLGRSDSIGPYEDEGIYVGIILKRTAMTRDPVQRPTSLQAGLGWGSYGDFVDYVDGFGGLSFGGGGARLAPFLSFNGGASLPYRRTYFDYGRSNVLSGYAPPPGRFRFATSLWLNGEGGLETLFGKRESGARLWLTYGYNIYRMLEKDDVRPRQAQERVVLSGFQTTFRMGLSYTY
jgi:hypothetical protein